MTDHEPTLLLTRPEPQSRAFLSQCETALGRRIPSVISPIMKIEPRGELPDLNRFDALVFTSGNGVRSVLEMSGLAGRQVWTVGETTARLAREAGAVSEALGEDVEGFLLAAQRVAGTVLLCRGVHSRGDLAERLRDQGVVVEEALIYDQVSRPLSSAARHLLSGREPVVAPIFSPRSARLLSAYGGFEAPLDIVAMSQAVADAWEGGGRVAVVAEPTSDAMREAVVSLISV